MTTKHILFAGGSGIVGRAAIRWFRERQPGMPLLVGGRNLDAAREVAREAGAAHAVAIDLDKPRLGLDDGVALAAVVMLAPDDGLRGLRYAQDLGIAYLNIGNGLVEVGPEMALFAHRATAAPVVLASQWGAGVAVFLALHGVKGFERVRSIRVGVVLDEQDAAGPLALEDMQRLSAAAPAALVFTGGKRSWVSGDAAKARIKAIDGRELAADAYSPFDIISLYAATGAPDIRFDLASGESSSRRRGDAVAAEIIVEIEGEAEGRPRRSRATLEFRHGQASLTGLSVVLSLSAVLGLNGGSPFSAGLYMPELLEDAEAYLDELRRAGAVIHEYIE